MVCALTDFESIIQSNVTCLCIVQYLCKTVLSMQIMFILLRIEKIMGLILR